MAGLRPVRDVITLTQRRNGCLFTDANQTVKVRPSHGPNWCHVQSQGDVSSFLDSSLFPITIGLPTTPKAQPSQYLRTLWRAYTPLRVRWRQNVSNRPERSTNRYIIFFYLLPIRYSNIATVYTRDHKRRVRKLGIKRRKKKSVPKPNSPSPIQPSLYLV